MARASASELEMMPPVRQVYCKTNWLGYEVETAKESRSTVPAISFSFYDDKVGLKWTLAALEEFDRIGPYLLNYASKNGRMRLPFWVSKEMFLRVFPGDCRYGNVYVRMANNHS